MRKSGMKFMYTNAVSAALQPAAARSAEKNSSLSNFILERQVKLNEIYGK